MSVNKHNFEKLCQYTQKIEGENKTLKKELETFKKAFYLLEETSTEIENKRDSEIESLKESRDKVLEEIKEVEKDGCLPDGDYVNVPTSLWLERLIQVFEEK